MTDPALESDGMEPTALILNDLAQAWPALASLPSRPQSGAEMLGRAWEETRLSAHLAWALDPRKNGIGLAPLLRFGELLGRPWPDDSQEVRVHREVDLGRAGRIDIVVESSSDVLAIEVKAGAAEHDGQTPRYAQALAQRYLDRDVRAAFLTPRGVAAQSPAFASVGFKPLVEQWRTMGPSRAADPHRAWFWEDVLLHMEALTPQHVTELSPKAKLYAQHRAMLEDLRAAWETEAEGWFNGWRDAVRAAAGPEWVLSMQPRRGWQQLYRPTWKTPLLNVHFEWHISQGQIGLPDFAFMVDVEGERKVAAMQLFRDLFSADRDLAGRCERLGISVCPSHRKNAIAWIRRKVDATRSLDDQLITAWRDLEFLAPYVDRIVTATLRPPP